MWNLIGFQNLHCYFAQDTINFSDTLLQYCHGSPFDLALLISPIQ